MKTNLRTIRIGHGAYSGTNALKHVTSKSAAVRELVQRGAAPAEARHVVTLAANKPNGYACLTINHDVVEIFAMNTAWAWGQA
jgi:hypothetical protein